MDSREAFEISHKKINRVIAHDYYTILEDGKYQHITCEADWELWQAAIEYQKEKDAEICANIASECIDSEHKKVAIECEEVIREQE